jgi:LmbE family N-acetylglucosaminyl deacetylase
MLAKHLSLMGVYAHPDDEQGASGSMRKYSQAGVRTTLVCATRGEAGEIAPGVEATPENLGSVREEEMRCAAKTIGVDNLYFLDYRDSGMAGTAINEDPLSFHQAPIFEVAEKITRIMRRERPQVITTFDPWGGYGHPDHIKIHRATLIAYFAAGDPRSFQEQIQKEGLEPWRPQKLYYGAFGKSRFQEYFDILEANGEPIPDMFRELIRRAIPDQAITTRIDVEEFMDVKIEALQCHASQLPPDSFFRRMPPEMYRERMKWETFVLAESRMGLPQAVETDLFEEVNGQPE